VFIKLFLDFVCLGKLPIFREKIQALQYFAQLSGGAFVFIVTVVVGAIPIKV
jgi:hypothetical protein